MAFEIELIVGSTTYSLSDGAPYKLTAAVGLGLPSVQRFTRRYPRQDGYDDSGYVLEPRVITLSLSFVATTAAALDGYRDDLTRMFMPRTNATLTLQVTRDDGEVRRVDVVTTALTIDVNPENYPGNLHRAVVQLRAADPVWYSPTSGTATFAALAESDWWLANYLIEDEIVLEHTDNPGSAQVWSFGTPISSPGFVYKHTIAFYGYTGGTGLRYAWSAQYPAASVPLVAHSYYGTAPTIGVILGKLSSSYFSIADETLDGTATFFSLITTVDVRDINVYLNGSHVGYFKSPWLMYPPTEASSYWLPGTAQVGDSTPALVFGSAAHAATYNRVLSETEIQNLHENMAGTFSSYTLLGTVAYDGNHEDYPTITLTGPLGDPVVTNITTDRKLDFTGSTIPAGVTYTIDLSREVLSVVDQGGTVHTDELTDDSDLGSWALAAGQSNVVSVTAGSTGTASVAQIVYRGRHVSY